MYETPSKINAALPTYIANNKICPVVGSCGFMGNVYVHDTTTAIKIAIDSQPCQVTGVQPQP